MRSCSRCLSFFIFQPRGAESLIIFIFSLFLLGKNIKAKSPHQGWITQGLKREGHMQGSGHCNSSPWVRFLMSSKGLVLLQLYPQ